MAVETQAERRVWVLLTRDFCWALPANFGVKVYGGADAQEEPARLQIFEVAVAAIFSRLRPEYDWYVTPNRPDGGIDFIGRQRFLHDEALGIAAAITVGGQCKKRTTVNDILDVVGNSLLRMADTINPTFFVVALSARLNPGRIARARQIIEKIHHRHCHILDRRQLEGLIQDHLPVVREILRVGLADEEFQEVLQYFAVHESARRMRSVDVAAPDRVLGGVPFSVTVVARPAGAGTRLWWRPSAQSVDPCDTDPGDTSIALVGPVGADGPAGIELSSEDPTDDPLRARWSIELVSFAVGRVDLGEIMIGPAGTDTADPTAWVDLGDLRIVDNLRPRFFERPFRVGITRMAHEYERALARGVGSIGVVGVGGSGKSRLCEEFSLERRRRGSDVVVAKQAKTLDEPQRVLADLFVGLSREDLSFADPADGVIEAVECYDSALAARARPAIRAIFGSDGQPGAVSDQSVLSSLLVLIMARSRRAPLIIHLQDLHWCTVDILMLLERLSWQLELILSGNNAPTRAPESGVLFVLEGRVRERQRTDDRGWVSEPFEAFLQKLDCTVVPCSSFARDDGLEFIGRLFEDRYSAQRRGSDNLLELQRQLVARIDRASGGNPFHSLEHVQLLKERRILGQNPETGLLYLIQPELSGATLPESVFEAIRVRWQDLRARTPSLALLVWAAALLEDRLPAELFCRLWRELAADISLADVDATEMLWTGGGQEREVAFRHENYFQSIRSFEVPQDDRARVVGVYEGWFADATRLDHADRFRWARVLLARPQPDTPGAQRQLRAALKGAQRVGDLQLGRRIAAASLDLTWSQDARAPIPMITFLRRCDDDLALARGLLDSDRQQAGYRLDGLRDRLERRLSSRGAQSPRAALEVERRKLVADVLRSHVLFNDRQPVRASAVAAQTVRRVQALRPDAHEPKTPEWEALEMEALHARGVALALSGEIDEALGQCGRAVAIARRSAPALSHRVLSTYANILLARDPATSEKLLRQCRLELEHMPHARSERDQNDINLGMTLVLRAHGLHDEPAHAELLTEASGLLIRVFTDCFRFGRYPDAGAAALLLGLVSVLHDDGDAASWFAQAVAAASRGRQMETLWRAHSNLATALYQRGAAVRDSVRDHACATVEVLEETLSPFPQPDRSARFRLVCAPLAQAVGYLVLADDERGVTVLERYPALRACFSDPASGILRDDRGGYSSHEWLRVGQQDYVLY